MKAKDIIVYNLTRPIRFVVWTKTYIDYWFVTVGGDCSQAMADRAADPELERIHQEYIRNAEKKLEKNRWWKLFP